MLASYPRSGNTLLRGYLEKILGIATGSDSNLDSKLIKQLFDDGFVGEGLADNRVQIVKSHYPERYAPTRVAASRAILLVRNPLDCITSFFNMILTETHEDSIHEFTYSMFKSSWEEHVEREITVWNEFYEFWILQEIPIHIIRFEDIIQSPEVALRSLVEFVLKSESIEGTIIEQKIHRAVKGGSPKIYTPR
jgi:hypothetical protein